MGRGAWWSIIIVHGVAESDTNEWLTNTLTFTVGHLIQSLSTISFKQSEYVFVIISCSWFMQHLVMIKICDSNVASVGITWSHHCRLYSSFKKCGKILPLIKSWKLLKFQVRLICEGLVFCRDYSLFTLYINLHGKCFVFCLMYSVTWNSYFCAPLQND